MSQYGISMAASRVTALLNSVSQSLSQQHSTENADYACYQLDCIIRLLGRYSDLFVNADQALQKLEEACHLLESGSPTSITGFRVPTVRMGNRGRPAFIITAEQLEYLLNFDFTIQDIARLLCVSVRTIKRRLKEHGLSVQQTFSDITSAELQAIVSAHLDTNPNSGYRMVNGYLRTMGIRVSESRLRETMQTVDPFGNLLRGLCLNPIQRRSYSVPAPLSLWHLDGYHKLIRWRIVIHGCIDGFSRKIMYLQASNNNKASTVHQAFLGAVQQFGLPLCVRSDKGGENVTVARCMLEHPLRGPESRCFITGRSVHNQRIERLWRDLWQSVVCNYHAVFQYMETTGALDSDNEIHLLCLHYVMIPRINAHLNVFRRTWDRHRISSAGNRSPDQLWISGQLTSEVEPTQPVSLSEWGNDFEGSLPASDSTADIVVPEHPDSLIQNVNRLLDRIDPLTASSCFGADLYMEALRLAEL
ncbi:uncharacterized protein [Nothobranchius furzeri]